MFHLFRKLFGRPAPVEVTPEYTDETPIQTGDVSVATSTAAPEEPPPVEECACLKIPVASLLPAAGEELRRFLSPRNTEYVLAPVDRLVPQLSHGTVTLSLGELRRLSPNVLLDVPLPDDVPVALPLAEVLRQVGPDRYTRRTDQKTVRVPDEVFGLFGKQGQRVVVSPAPLKGPARPAPAPPARPTAAEAKPSPHPAGPTPAPPAAYSLRPAWPATPASPRPSPAQPTPAAFPPASPVARPAAGARPAPVSPPTPEPTRPEGQTLRVPLAPVSQQWPDEVRRDMAALEVPVAEAHLLLPVDAVAQGLRFGQLLFPWKRVCFWIEPRVAFSPAPAAGDMLIELPLPLIAPLFMAQFRATSQRRVDVSAEIPDLFGKYGPPARTTPGLTAPPPGPPPRTATLSAGPPPIAAEARPTPAPVRVTIPVHAAPEAEPVPVPLRVSNPVVQPAPAPAASTITTPPSPPAAAPPAPQLAAPVPPPAAPAKPEDPASDLDRVLGPAGQRFGARDIVLNTARLPGAVGALLAMNDGLLVTSAVPPQVKGEMVAAFLPQIYGRMTQYARELGMGALRGLAFEVEGGSWQVVREPNIFFAVLSRSDKAPPLSQLSAIAVELNQQQQ
jgi:predicted regulator of Ras-like GTPase activity (Roadblock/LC7/MglB family)